MTTKRKFSENMAYVRVMVAARSRKEAIENARAVLSAEDLLARLGDGPEPAYTELDHDASVYIDLRQESAKGRFVTVE